jgi:hypothetical protein
MKRRDHRNRWPDTKAVDHKAVDRRADSARGADCTCDRPAIGHDESCPLAPAAPPETMA